MKLEWAILMLELMLDPAPADEPRLEPEPRLGIEPPVARARPQLARRESRQPHEVSI